MIIVCMLCTTLVIEAVEGCNGYKLIVNRFEDCIPNSLVKINKFDLVLDNNCYVIPSGCITTTKGFTTATVHYIVSKPPIPTLEGDENACSYLRDYKDARMASLFQLPKQCPVSANKVCGDASKKISVSQYKSKLSLFAGNLSMKLDFTHDTGVSCINLHLTLKKN
ncbi:uncharacterized protein LOC116166522 [Photinus pyralis]|uniref:uncharacterized protein LOC116166522 n=1 Tax=Photinus pyralis TaxID=7054 RepID=UPI0012672072|nr:uncharacterized protein LOC116166522 [Photinus pyralis]